MFSPVLSCPILSYSAPPLHLTPLPQAQRMEMMHLASKKKELEHNIANCPNEALKNRFRAELQGVQNDIKRLEQGGFT